MPRKTFTHVRNVETGEVFEATPDSVWTEKLTTWRNAMRECGNDVRKCPVPSPMPVGHLMFRGTSPNYRPLAVVPTAESIAFENAFA
jgi:hypothetical protein